MFVNKYATLLHIFFQSAGLLLLIVPIITMRLFAEERKAGTLELLLTAPVRESQVVLAKYVAAMAVVLAMIALTGALCASCWACSARPIGGRSTAATSASPCSRARWSRSASPISALTSNQIVAAIVTIGFRSCCGRSTRWPAMMPEALERVLISLSLLAHFTPFATGAMYTSDFGFFVSSTLLALFLAMRALARR